MGSTGGTSPPLMAYSRLNDSPNERQLQMVLKQEPTSQMTREQEMKRKQEIALQHANYERSLIDKSNQKRKENADGDQFLQISSI